MFSLTFDWYYVSPTVISNPFIYTVNYIAGTAFFLYIVTPILLYKNAFRQAYDPKIWNGFPSPVSKPEDTPLNTPWLFNVTGHRIRARDLYDKKTFDLNLEAYNKQGPIFLTEMFAMDYMTNFLALSAMFSHVILWQGTIN